MKTENFALNAVFEEVSNYFSISTRETVKITQIDYIALRTWSETWKSINTRTPPNGGWDWTYRRNYFKKYSSKLLFDKEYGFTYIKGGLHSKHYCEKQVA